MIDETDRARAKRPAEQSEEDRSRREKGSCTRRADHLVKQEKRQKQETTGI